MVKFRGIEVSLTSHFDVRRFPEFSIPPQLYSQRSAPSKAAAVLADPFTEPVEAPSDLLSTPESVAKKSIASCFVPIWPGSQVWLEYGVQPPHPPNASYFFKLLHNEQSVASWDCTGQNGYGGKVHHVLNFGGNGEAQKMILQFSTDIAHCSKPGMLPENDCLEVRIHRIGARKRLNIEEMIARLQEKPTDRQGGDARLGYVQFVDRTPRNPDSI